MAFSQPLLGVKLQLSPALKDLFFQEDMLDEPKEKPIDVRNTSTPSAGF